MKVLLFCPLNPDKDRQGRKTVQIYGKTNQSIFRQDYPKLDMWFSKGDNPFFDSNGRHNIAHNYNKARQWVLDNGYDALITVEADMVIPPDAVTKMVKAAEDADVVYGLYVFKNATGWSAWTELDYNHGRSLSKDKNIARSVWGKTIEVAGVGNGCTLIKRNVLEKIAFRTDEENPGTHQDWWFAIDCQTHGFRQVCDTSIVCGHIDTKPSPRIIWPDPEQPRLYNNEYLYGIPINDKGELVFELDRLGDFMIRRSDVGLPELEG
jgi:hypothetical protein